MLRSEPVKANQVRRSAAWVTCVIRVRCAVKYMLMPACTRRYTPATCDGSRASRNRANPAAERMFAHTTTRFGPTRSMRRPARNVTGRARAWPTVMAAPTRASGRPWTSVKYSSPSGRSMPLPTESIRLPVMKRPCPRSPGRPRRSAAVRGRRVSVAALTGAAGR